MVWVKVDDQIPHHPKFVTAGAVASWLWICGNCHCNRYLTNGFIAGGALVSLGVIQNVAKHAKTLVTVGLWEVTTGGYQVHDFLDFNPSRDDVLRDRTERHAAKVNAGRNGGLATAKQKASRELAEAQQAASQSAGNGTQQNGSPVPSRPVPSRPTERKERAPSRAREAPGKAYAGERLEVPDFMHDEFSKQLGANLDAFDLLAWYPTLDAELVASGEPFDTIPWLRARFRKDAKIPLPDRPLAVREHRPTVSTRPARPWREDCHHEPECENFSAHELKMAMATHQLA